MDKLEFEFDIEGCSYWVIFFEVDTEKVEIHIHHLVGYEDIPTPEQVDDVIKEIKTDVYPEVGDAVDGWTHTVLTTDELKDVLPEMFE